MNKKLIKIPACLFALVLAFSMFPAGALAAETTTNSAEVPATDENTTSEQAVEPSEESDASGDPSEEAPESENATTPTAQAPSKNKKGVKSLKLAGGVKVLSDTNWYNSSATTLHIGANAGHDGADELVGLASLVNDGTEDFDGKTIVLDEDLDMAGNASLILPPIGTEEKPFKGTFDGDGHYLDKLAITLTPNAPKSYIGLFGYVGEGGAIKNLELQGGKITLSENATNGAQIRYIGGIAGYSKGKITNCTSSLDIEISSKRASIDKPKAGDDNRTTDQLGAIREVGGLVGHLDADMEDSSHSGEIKISSSANAYEYLPYIAGEVGGLVGVAGALTAETTYPTIGDCVNSGNLVFNVNGSGGKDRFGSQLRSQSFGVGGIVGVTNGDVKSCSNMGDINTSTGTLKDPTTGLGASSTGGVVGVLRGNGFDKTTKASLHELTSDPGYDVWKNSNGTTKPETTGVYDSSNSGTVIGLTGVGGLVGLSGSFTEVEGCGNSADVKGTRWNKPYVGGVVGNGRSDIRYSFNRGEIYSVTGGGFFCAGISGGFSSLNRTTTPDELRFSAIEMTGCYSAGKIFTDATGYRTGILAGECDNGYIHANTYLPNLTLDGKLTDDNRGTLEDNLLCTQEELKGSVGISKLNTYAAGIGQWATFFLPDLADENEGFPILAHNASTTVNSAGIDISSATPTLVSDAIYSAAIDPVPIIKVEFSGETLLQNADYYVVSENGTKQTSPSDTYYTATIVGMGKYKGTLSATVPYQIAKAQISTCTIVAAPAIFNWEQQEPAKVELKDTLGNIVDEDEYAWETRANADGNYSGVKEWEEGKEITKYFDYIYCHSPTYKYDIKATALPESANYEGTTTQAAFRIDWADMFYDGKESESDPPRPEPVKYDKIVWGSNEWNYLDVREDKTGDLIQIPYTGRPIKPTIKNVTYLGHAMTNGTGKSYWYNPLRYDYKYVYGNPNPEQNDDQSYGTQTNVTPANTPECVTVRFTTGGNFKGYVILYYRIVPAQLSSAKFAAIPAQDYSINGAKPNPKITFNGKTLVKGKDYSLTYSNNTKRGKATVVVKGKNNFVGSKTLTFSIVKASAAKLKVSKIKAQKYTGTAIKKGIKPSVVVKQGGTTLKKGVHYTIKFKNHKKVGTASVVIKGKGNYTGNKTIKYKIKRK